MLLFVVVSLHRSSLSFNFIHSFCHYIIPLFVVNSFVCYIEPLGSVMAIKAILILILILIHAAEPWQSPDSQRCCWWHLCSVQRAACRKQSLLSQPSCVNNGKSRRREPRTNGYVTTPHDRCRATVPVHSPPSVTATQFKEKSVGGTRD